MKQFKQLVQELLQPLPIKNTALTLKKSKKVRKLIVLRHNAAYQQCIEHCKSLGVTPIKRIKSLHAILLHVDANSDTALLRQHKFVKRIETDHKLKLHLFKKNSPLKALSCASNNRAQIVPWGIARIEGPKLWSRTQGNPIRIAVLDTGIARHPDLRIMGSVNTINRKPVIDLNGHGTHVAGTIAALCNRFGVVGVAPKARLYAVQAFNPSGSAYTSDIIQGIDWCIRNRIQVINMSFGMSEFNASLQDIIRKAYRRGIIMVASCGNDGPNNSTIDYPARFPETIAVAASAPNNQITSFSSRGTGISVAAPGLDVCSTYLDQSYATLSGTSMAAPHVSGAAALLLGINPRFTPADVKRRLENSAVPLKNSSLNSQGSGIIHIPQAMNIKVSKPLSKMKNTR
jgi:minor extracellular protease Epr